MNNHALISPTAKLTAYMRAETDIPFSKEIAEVCDARKTVEEIFDASTDELSWMPAMFELRYKSLTACLQKELKERNISQVLELGAGILPRGITMSENPAIHYIETDLPEIVEEKKTIITEIDLTILERSNYALTTLNVVNANDFSKVESLFTGEKVAILNEGLITYLSLEEKEVVAENIHAFLKKYGGVWITPDLSNSGRMQKIIELFPNAHITNEKLGEAVGRNLKTNSIPGGKAGAVAFYENYGFTVTEYRATELAGPIGTLTKVVDEEKRKRLFDALDLSCVWVLEAK